MNKPTRTKNNKLFSSVILPATQMYRQCLAAFFCAVGPEVAYAITRVFARLIYRLLTPLATIGEQQCAAALSDSVKNEESKRYAADSFVHRAWNLTDLMLARRFLHPSLLDRHGGRIPPPYDSRLCSDVQNRVPVLFVTAYYGPFDLLPIFLGFNGISAGVIYRKHANPQFDKFRQEVRSRGGCDLIPVERAAQRADAILQSGGLIAIVADHHDEHRGMEATFLNLPTKVPRSVALLAWRHQAKVVVAGIRRVEENFRFQIVVEDVFEPSAWQQADDAVEYITHRYLRGLERLVLADPAQYIWAQPRWGYDIVRKLHTAGEQRDARSD